MLFEAETFQDSDARQILETAAAVSGSVEPQFHESGLASDTFAAFVRCAGADRSDGRTAAFTLTLPRRSAAVFQQAAGIRLLWWPRGICRRRRAAVISSRLQGRPDRNQDWFNVLRTAVLRSADSSGVVWFSESVATGPAVRVAARLFEIRHCEMVLPRRDSAVDHDELIRWIMTQVRELIDRRPARKNAGAADDSEPRQLPGASQGEQPENSSCSADGNAAAEDAAAGTVAGAVDALNDIGRMGGEDSASDRLSARVVISPRLRDSTNQTSILCESLPTADVLTGLAGEHIRVVDCREGSVTESVIRHFAGLRPKERPLMIQAGGSRAGRSAAVGADGVVDWLLEESRPQVRCVTTAEVPSGCEDAQSMPDSEETARDSQGPIVCPHEWLCHWTRARRGAWPEQTVDDHLEELLLGCESADRSAFAALLKILGENCVRASLQGAGKEPTAVSLTAVPLSEFRRRRTYRKHRMRFDFEPWGVAIHRSLLSTYTHGPVRYVDSDRNTTADSKDVPAEGGNRGEVFLHPRFSRSRKIDWSEEQEWRVIGDLNLGPEEDNRVVVFTDTRSEAERLRQLTVRPVLVLPAAE